MFERARQRFIRFIFVLNVFWVKLGFAPLAEAAAARVQSDFNLSFLHFTSRLLVYYGTREKWI